MDVQKLESHLHTPVDAGVCVAAFLWASVSQINHNSCGQGECKGPCWFQQSRAWLLVSEVVLMRFSSLFRIADCQQSCPKPEGPEACPV